MGPPEDGLGLRQQQEEHVAMEAGPLGGSWLPPEGQLVGTDTVSLRSAPRSDRCLSVRSNVHPIPGGVQGEELRCTSKLCANGHLQFPGYQEGGGRTQPRRGRGRTGDRELPSTQQPDSALGRGRGGGLSPEQGRGGAGWGSRGWLLSTPGPLPLPQALKPQRRPRPAGSAATLAAPPPPTLADCVFLPLSLPRPRPPPPQPQLTVDCVLLPLRLPRPRPQGRAGWPHGFSSSSPYAQVLGKRAC